MDKVAILILAHKNIEQQIKLLCSMFEDKLYECFVHVDAKNNEKFDFSQNANIHLCEERIDVSIFHFSLTDATNLLLKTAMKYEEEREMHFKYFCLISGLDFPIMNTTLIYDDLMGQYPNLLMDICTYNEAKWLKKPYSKVWHEHYIYAKLNKIKNIWFRKLCKLPFKVLYTPFRIFFSHYKVLTKKNIDIAGGSAWWCMPDWAAKAILTNEFNALYKYTKKCGAPEESVYQTFCYNYYRDQCKITTYNPLQANCKTYANFRPTDPKKKYCGHPYALDINDYNHIKDDKFYFARKFDINENYEVIQEVIKVINGYE